MTIVLDFGKVLFEWNPEQLVSDHFPAALRRHLSSAKLAERLEAHWPWIARFDNGIFSGRVNMATPDGDIYTDAERRFKLDPVQTMFVGDSPSKAHAACGRAWHADVIEGTPGLGSASMKHGGLQLLR